MTTDHRMTSGFIIDVLDVLERHGYHRHDNLHTGQAVVVIGDLAHVYEGTYDAPYGTYPGQALPPEAEPPGPEADQDAVILTAAEARTIATALDEAAGYKRDRAGICADCPDQSCPACQSRLQAAQTYDHLATQLTQTAEAARTANASQPEQGSQPQPTAELEAGQ